MSVQESRLSGGGVELVFEGRSEKTKVTRGGKNAGWQLAGGEAIPEDWLWKGLGWVDAKRTTPEDFLR